MDIVAVAIREFVTRHMPGARVAGHGWVPADSLIGEVCECGEEFGECPECGAILHDVHEPSGCLVVGVPVTWNCHPTEDPDAAYDAWREDSLG